MGQFRIQDPTDKCSSQLFDQTAFPQQVLRGLEALGELIDQFRVNGLYVGSFGWEPTLGRALHKIPDSLAWHYARPKRPKWLTVTDVERELIDSCSHGEAASAAYQSHWQPQVSAELRWIVESAGAHAGQGRPRLEGLLCLGSERTSAWMKWKTFLADGPCSGTSILPPATILAAVHELGRPEKILVANRQNDQHELLCLGLLRKLSEISMQEIAQRLHTIRSRADRLMRKQVQLITQNEAYAALALRAAQGISYKLAFRDQNPAKESRKSVNIALAPYFPYFRHAIPS